MNPHIALVIGVYLLIGAATLAIGLLVISKSENLSKAFGGIPISGRLIGAVISILIWPWVWSGTVKRDRKKRGADNE